VLLGGGQCCVGDLGDVQSTVAAPSHSTWVGLSVSRTSDNRTENAPNTLLPPTLHFIARRLSGAT
jgi:hypothetical protein